MPKVDIDTAYIENLAELLARTGLTEIEICQGDARIRVARQVASSIEYLQPAAAAAAPSEARLADVLPAETAHPGTVTSPMVGTVYLLPEPGAPPFVRVGDQVKEGQTLLIIEAMKTFNPIKAPKAGVVAQVLVENARPVEFAEVLMIIE